MLTNVSLYVWAGRKCAGGGGGGRGGMRARLEDSNESNIGNQGQKPGDENYKATLFHILVSSSTTMGTIMSRSELCLDAPNRIKMGPAGGVKIVKCHFQGGNQYWVYSIDGELRRDDMCLDYIFHTVTILPCKRSASQIWLYDLMIKVLGMAQWLHGLAEDMKFLASMPELCDVTFLVGDTREPVVFQKMLYQAPSPQRKKEPAPRENKLRLFLKRSSEPLLNLQNAAQQRSAFAQQLAPIQEPSSQQHQTLIIEEFEPDVFRQLIEYIHTGCVTLQPRTLLGVMNAADYYGLDELRRACAGFVQCCITVDTVLEFVDEHGNEVLNLGSFTLLPQHVVRLILARDELRADEFTKFQAALMWSKKYCDTNPNINLKEVIGNFLEYIQFHKIPANVLMREVHPLGLVPYSIIMNALAYQADPASIDPGKLSPARVRRAGRSMSVQSSLDPYGSNTTLSSTGSSDVPSSDSRHN
ncbi:hypothetical protein MSG28_010121 [Choristoneura fumiferana]|uniref:Uncharacterized protein n=1 Tax=Choristoneura fumiferana TaxID=7141 RepID=A0ACC0KKE6_CHOFU|nr:hypothetical protein MSG28_010121 [Choristoneura fumiferana]